MNVNPRWVALQGTGIWVFLFFLLISTHPAAAIVALIMAAVTFWSGN